MKTVSFEIKYNGVTHNATLSYDNDGGMMTHSEWDIAEGVISDNLEQQCILEWITCGFWEGGYQSDELEADEYFEHAIEWKIV